MIASTKNLKFNINLLFGMLKDNKKNIDSTIRNLRKGRSFDI
ncbi:MULTISPECIES: hypothetical protein [Arcobacteraceae]|nr:hypothetical protein [Arcobacter sp. CECT 9188]